MIFYTLTLTCFIKLIPDLTPKSDFLMLISYLLHSDVNMILKLISHLILTMISDLTVRSDLLMLICDLLQTFINMILNTNIWSNTEIWLTLVDFELHIGINTIVSSVTWSNTCLYLIYYTLIWTWFLMLIPDLTPRSDLLLLLSDLLQTDINMTLNTNIWFSTNWYLI